MEKLPIDLEVPRLGECRISSPLSGIHFVPEDERVLVHSNLGEVRRFFDQGALPPAFETMQ